MSYKDQTFCNDWCGTTTCFRNYQHIKDAQEAGKIDANTQISFFVALPVDCTIRTPKEP